MSVATLINDRSPLSIPVVIAAAFASIVLGAPARCRANQEPWVELTWEAPANCPQQTEVQEQIQNLLSGLERTEWHGLLSARGAIEFKGEQFELTLLIQHGRSTGKRVIASDDCRSLGKAAAVVIGLLMRKEQKLGRQLSAGEMSDSVELSTKPTEPTSGASNSSALGHDRLTVLDARGSSQQWSDAPSSTQWHPLIIAPNLTLDLGTLPKPGLGAGLGFGLVVRSWRMFVSGEIWPSQSKRLPLDLGHSSEASFQRKSLEFVACSGWSWHPLELAPCVQLAVDHIAAQANGDRITPKSPSAVLVSAGGGFGGFWHLGQRASLFLLAMGRVATRRPSFVVQGPFASDEIHTVPPASVFTSLGCMWIF